MSIIGRVLYWLVPVMLVGTLFVLSGMLIADDPTTPWAIGMASNTAILAVGLVVAFIQHIKSKRSS